jgi:hypothetical protein
MAHDPQHAVALAHRLARFLVGLPDLLLGFLALRHVEHQRNAMVRGAGERGRAEEHGDARAVPADELFLEGCRRAERGQFLDRRLIDGLPLRRGHRPPVYPPRFDILPAVADDLQKTVVSVADLPADLPKEQAHHTGFGDTTQALLALAEAQNRRTNERLRLSQLRARRLQELGVGRRKLDLGGQEVEHAANAVEGRLQVHCHAFYLDPSARSPSSEIHLDPLGQREHPAPGVDMRVLVRHREIERADDLTI